MTIKNIVKQFRLYSLQGLFRKLRLYLQGKDILITGMCAGCGRCCNKINLQTSKGWVRSEGEFSKVCNKFPEYKRFNIVGRDEQGFLQFSCSWVTEDGLCGDYANRLSICKKFPDKSLHFCGGTLPVDCGFEISQVTPFSKVLKKEMESEK